MTTVKRLGGPRALRAGPASFRVRPRPLLLVPAGLAVLALLMALNIGRGDYPIGVGEVVRTLLGSPENRFVVMELRLPRALTGALVGAALGLSGALTQSITRNPLASPDTLGVGQGASVVVVALTVATGSAAGGAGGALAGIGIPLAALAGGLVSGVFVYMLAWRSGLDGYRLVLVGIGFAGVASNIKWWLLALGDVNDASRAMAWITGTLNARGWEHVRPVALALAVLVPAVLIGAFALGSLRLGDEPARGLGLRVNLSRSLLVLAAIVLASIATASAGPVEFVALAAPQIAMRLAGTGQPPLVGSLVTGAVLTVGADLIARTAFGGVELPVGVVTAVLGAPLLVYLLVRSRRKAIL
ncbi:FecCD family ABC transporter permease [Actinomadura rudentiformis]|uniref:Iron chelate uptake ABC transporter family permease subunit n=1 Tax=Actinomadura rudentiformis TaxID=359158 RepID=A0A6H9Z4J9_9ACTN|nr:iron chelate uptake ABC transporter family permease subunit [Actinomadura rudentiformis]KAB2350871.1 iron chelate uptake ABC transporter family permease subunit [Actinomadura rudentiformis]